MRTRFISHQIRLLRLMSFLFLAAMLLSSCTDKSYRILMIGDSTMADKKAERFPETGWGQALPQFFQKDVNILNFARNGRSSKSFIDEGRWQTVMDSLRAGDYVFIQFSHNDEKAYDSTRYTEPETTFKENLRKFVNESRSKKAFPVLATPIVRRKFAENGNLVETHGDYPDAIRDVAAEMDVPLIDMQKKSTFLIQELGVEESKNIYLWIKPGAFTGYPEGAEDNTHFSQEGAKQIAALAVKGIRELGLPLDRKLK